MKFEVKIEYSYFKQAFILFRIPFTLYFLGYIIIEKKKFFMLFRKEFDYHTGYYWKVI